MFVKILFICLLTFLAGFVDSIAGGGGLLSFPAFLAIGLPYRNAWACNKFSATLGTSAAVLQYQKKNYLTNKSLLGIIPALIGSLIGSQLLLFLPDAVLHSLFLFCLPFLVFLVFFVKNVDNEKKDISQTKINFYFRLCIATFFVGLYDGIIGPGAGTLYIISFVSFLYWDFLTATANAKIFNLASNLASLLLAFSNHVIIYKYAIPAAIFNIMGNVLGASVASTANKLFIRMLIIFVLCLLILKIIYDQIHTLS